MITIKRGNHAKEYNMKPFYFKISFILFILILNIILASTVSPNNNLSNSLQIASTSTSAFENSICNKNEDNNITSNEIIENSQINNQTNIEVVINKEDTNQNTAITTSDIIETTTDENIQNLIENYIADENLNEENFAFFYYNEDTKKQYFYNEDTYFTAASTVKLPVAMLYYDKINDGSMLPTDTLLYKSSDYEAGNGSTSYNYSAGSYVPLNFLLEQSIVNSDNTAINILMSNYGYTQCRKDINTKYVNEELDDSFYNSNLTFGRYAFNILNYLYLNIDNYSQLIEHLKISSEGQYLKKYLDDYDVAHKYGSYNGYIHDYGIVFADTTYLIGVFTKNVSNASELIADISLKVLENVNTNTNS